MINASRRLSTHLVDPRVDASWATLVAGSPRGTLFHSPQWMQVVAETYNFEPAAELLIDGDRTIGGAAHVRIDDELGQRTVMTPFSDFTDPLVETFDDWLALSEQLLATDEQVTVRVRDGSCALHDPRFDAESIGTWHVAEIMPGDEQQWDALHGSARRNIRRATASGVTIEIGAGLDNLREFYELHSSIRKYKYRLLPQPWRFFESIHRVFGGEGTLHVLIAKHEERAIGGVVAIQCGDTLYYKFNASALDELAPRPNDLLAWETIRLARRLGLRQLDFGFSDADQQGLVRYKDKFATSKAAVWRLSRPARALPSAASRLRRSLNELTQLLTDARVPDDITEAAGSALYRYFA